MVGDNIYPIITSMEEKCKLWYKLSWFGRIAAVKMILLPNLIFVMLSAIIDIPEKVLNKIQAVIKFYLEPGNP